MILAFDGALGAFTCALADDEGVRVRRVDGKQTLERGLAAVDALLRERGALLADCERIAVGTGPGGFTGLRIAIAFAKSLAFAARRPLVGVSSYDALEPAGAALPVAVFVSGRSGVVCARWREEGGPPETGCGRTAEVVERIPERPEWNVVGPTEDVLAAFAERARTVRILPRRAGEAAVAIAALGRSAPLPSSPHAVVPDYGELPATSVRRSP